MSIKTKLCTLLTLLSCVATNAYAVGQGVYIGVAAGATTATGKTETAYVSPFNLPLLVSPSGVMRDNLGNILAPGSYFFSNMYQVYVPPPHTYKKNYIPLPPPNFIVTPSGQATNSQGVPLPAGQYQVFNAVNIKPKTATGTGERLFMGMRFNPYGAFEIGYTHYAPITFQRPAGTNVPQSNPAIRANVVDLDGVFIYPLSKFAIFGKVGMGVIRLSQSGSLLSPTKSGAGGTQVNVKPLVGAGVSYDLTQQWVLDFTYTRLVGGGTITGVTFAGVGISYHFADKLCGQFLC